MYQYNIQILDIGIGFFRFSCKSLFFIGNKEHIISICPPYLCIVSKETYCLTIKFIKNYGW